MDLKQLRKIDLPDNPGVYFFSQKNPPSHKATARQGEILYIGKATSLKRRLESYFRGDLMDTRGPAILDMVRKADKVKWQETDSVLEALILETELIKKHQPKYNTKEKSDKSFNFVCISKEVLPKVVIKRGKDIQAQACLSGKQAQKFSGVFGPYPNGSQLKLALSIIRKIFPFLDDKSKAYKEFYRQIGLAPDLKDKRMYLENIKNLKLFFKGKKKRIIQNLKKEMKIYADKREFEKAGEIKRQIFALQHINDVALIGKTEESKAIFSPASFFGHVNRNKTGPSDGKILPSASSLNSNLRIEAYDIAHMSGGNMVGVMVVIENGDLAKSEYRKFKINKYSEANDTGALREILSRRFAHKEWRMPDLIAVDGGIPQIHAAKLVLKETKMNIPVVSVLKDKRHKPKEILGKYQGLTLVKSQVLLANNEAHRFATKYHKNIRAKNFLNRKLQNKGSRKSRQSKKEIATDYQHNQQLWQYS